MPTRVWLSGISSVTHLVQAASYLRPLSAREPDAVLVPLGAGAFLGRRNVKPEDFAERLPAGMQRGSGWRSRPGERLVYVAVGAPGIKPLLRLRAANPGRRLHVVVVDEGLGSYGDWRSRRDAWQREGGGRVWPTVRAWAVLSARVRLTDERWALYTSVAGRWTVDERVAAEMRAGVNAVPTVPHAVLLTQPWVELGILSPDALQAFVDQIRTACAAAGLPLQIRRHPSETGPALQGVDILTGRGPAELDPRVVGAAVVLGTASTALLNIAALHGTPALRLSLPGVAEVDARLNADQRGLLDTFLPRPAPLECLPTALREVLP